jgi:hypothetical protein
MAAGLGAVMVAAIVLAATPRGVVLAASEDERAFHQLQRALEMRWGGHVQHIPMQWLVSGMAGAYTHGGVSRMRIAEMDELPKRIDGAELETMATARMGAGWQRIVRETSREGDEQSLIYMKPEGNRLAMMVVDFDNGEMDMVEMAIQPNQLSKQIRRWEHEDAQEDKATADGE